MTAHCGGACERPLTAPTGRCVHVPTELAEPRADWCETCGTRSSLRVCATCGHVGCCESSGGHARRHALTAGHPVILSLPVTASSFVRCYDCRDYVG